MLFKGKNYYETAEFRAYTTLAVYDSEDLPSDFLQWHVDNNHPVELNGETVELGEKVKMFLENNFTCSACGLQGTVWALQKSGNRPYHLNLWGVDGTGSLRLFTKSKGDDDVSFVVKCMKCSGRK